MKRNVRLILYILLAILVVPTFYSIFNVGNPNSWFRHIVKDPSYDMLITVLLALSMGVIGFILSLQAKRQNSIEHMLDMNKEHIRFLRSKGKTDYSIANEFLDKLKVQKSGILYKFAFRRVLRYLQKMD